MFYQYFLQFSKIIIIIRGKQFRVFLSGDYEFVCKMYGISGASGTSRICTKFSKAFNLLSECHSLYNSKEIEEDNLQKLGKQNNVNTNISVTFLFNRNLTSKLHDLLS